MSVEEKMKKFLSNIKVAEDYELSMNPKFKGFDRYFEVTHPEGYENPKISFIGKVPPDVKVMLTYAWRDAMYGED